MADTKEVIYFVSPDCREWTSVTVGKDERVEIPPGWTMSKDRGKKGQEVSVGRTYRDWKEAGFKVVPK